MNNNFIKKHWNGEYSLPVSYWLISALLVNIVTVISMVLLEYLDKNTNSLTSNFWIISFQLILFVTIVTWSLRGTWISATKYKGSKVWSTLVYILIIVLFINLSNSINTYYIPVLKEHSKFMFGGDNLGKAKLEGLDNGETLKITGNFGNGSYILIKEFLQSNKEIKKIYLESDGGRLKEVMQIAELIKSKELSTYVETKCLSFCTVVFLSGYPRYSTPNARIGFHSPSYGSLNKLNGEFKFDQQAIDVYKSFNLPDVFIKKIFETPNDKMWYPSHEELVELGIVSHVSLGDESDTLKSLDTAKLEDTLNEMELYKKYEKKFPGTIKKIVEIVESGKKQGLNDNQVMANARNFLSQYSLKVIIYSTPEIRHSYLKLAIDQMEASLKLGGNACIDLLNGRLNIVKTLPAELYDRELKLSLVALDSDFVAPEKFSDQDYQKVLETALPSFTDDELAAFTDMNKADPYVACRAFIKFYKSFLNLSSEDRDIAIYGTFKSVVEN